MSALPHFFPLFQTFAWSITMSLMVFVGSKRPYMAIVTYTTDFFKTVRLQCKPCLHTLVAKVDRLRLHTKTSYYIFLNFFILLCNKVVLMLRKNQKRRCVQSCSNEDKPGPSQVNWRASVHSAFFLEKLLHISFCIRLFENESST